MNPLIDKLKDVMLKESLIGFCHWDDGDGTAWGRILDVSETRIRVHEVDPMGKDTEVRDYEIAEIQFFDDTPTYAKRLELLRDFSPTMPEESAALSKENEIFSALEDAFKTGEIIRIGYPGNEELDGQVIQIGSGWIELADHNDLMVQRGSVFVKKSSISELTWRNARCEADGYLLGLN